MSSKENASDEVGFISWVSGETREKELNSFTPFGFFCFLFFPFLAFCLGVAISEGMGVFIGFGVLLGVVLAVLTAVLWSLLNLHTQYVNAVKR